MTGGAYNRDSTVLYSFSDCGVSSNLIGSLSCSNRASLRGANNE